MKTIGPLLSRLPSFETRHLERGEDRVSAGFSAGSKMDAVRFSVEADLRKTIQPRVRPWRAIHLRGAQFLDWRKFHRFSWKAFARGTPYDQEIGAATHA